MRVGCGRRLCFIGGRGIVKGIKRKPYNFLYDLAQITIPRDNVDDAFIQKPHHWDIGLIRRFMFWIGPISSVYDFLTFYVLLQFFRAGEAEFHTGWFVESLATQTLVIFVIRTFGNPLRSKASVALTVTG